VGPSLILLIGLVAGGCATHYRNAVHPSYGQVDFGRDKYDCDRESDYGKYSVMFREWEKSARASQCLRARGWVKD